MWDVGDGSQRDTWSVLLRGPFVFFLADRLSSCREFYVEDQDGSPRVWVLGPSTIHETGRLPT